jgi:hypothetical protein
MTYRVLLLITGTLFLAACSPSMSGGGMQHGNGMMGWEPKRDDAKLVPAWTG